MIMTHNTLRYGHKFNSGVMSIKSKMTQAHLNSAQSFCNEWRLQLMIIENYALFFIDTVLMYVHLFKGLLC